jgi:hypothetical protein
MELLLEKLHRLNMCDRLGLPVAKKHVAKEFSFYYGTDVSRKEKWQATCQDFGLSLLIPLSITNCKKVTAQ